MEGALAAAGAAIAAGDLWLVVTCWKHQGVLGGVLGAVGIPLVAFATASGLTGSAGEGVLVIALILLIVGVALYGLGQTLERLLDDPPEEQTCDAGASLPPPTAAAARPAPAASDAPLTTRPRSRCSMCTRAATEEAHNDQAQTPALSRADRRRAGAHRLR